MADSCRKKIYQSIILIQIKLAGILCYIRIRYSVIN